MAVNWMQQGMQLVSSFGFWAVMLILTLGGAWFIAWNNRRNKLSYLAEEWIPLSPSKYIYQNINGVRTLTNPSQEMSFEVRYTTAGWFKEKKQFFNLWEIRGPLQMELHDGRKILNASSEDYVMINGKKAIRVLRKGDDPKMLVPLSKVKIDNYQLIQHIAPADYQDAASKFIDDKVLETMNSMERWAGPIMLGVTIVIFLICLILIIQFSNQRMDKILALQQNLHCSMSPSNAP